MGCPHRYIVYGVWIYCYLQHTLLNRLLFIRTIEYVTLVCLYSTNICIFPYTVLEKTNDSLAVK